MKKVAYLLHRFPALTDTFVKREIRALLQAGTEVTIISVWKPRTGETRPEILSEWADYTHFLLPQALSSVGWIIFATILRRPWHFASTFHLAWHTAPPGIRGFGFQLFYFCEAVLAAEVVRRTGVNHLHNHNGDQSGTVTMLAARLADVGYSITFHGWPVFFDAKNAHIKEKVRRARFTRSISYFCRSQLMMFSESDDAAPFKVVHCGVEIERYRPKPPADRVKTLFCAARLSPEKGHLFLLQAVKLVLDKGYDIELRLGGDGPSRERLGALTRDLQISAHVRFLGFLYEDSITEELQRADLFVLPSFVEGVPVSAMEAMAAGVPVIATNVAGTSELIEHGKNGLLVRPADANALADAIVEVIENREFRIGAVDLARKKVVAEFDAARETAKLNLFLLDACGRAKTDREVSGRQGLEKASV
jgi:glycosyltransferase involved in cell wall biosynthesis